MIVKQLIQGGFCFAVVQYYSFLTRAKIYTNQEWELIASKVDKKELSKLGFSLNNDTNLPRQHQNPEGILSREMSLEEIREFKALKDEFFVKAIENEDGVVWELKDKSLKQLHNENY